MMGLEQRLLNVLAFQGGKGGCPLYDIKCLQLQKQGLISSIFHTLINVPRHFFQAKTYLSWQNKVAEMPEDHHKPSKVVNKQEPLHLLEPSNALRLQRLSEIPFYELLHLPPSQNLQSDMNCLTDSLHLSLQKEFLGSTYYY